MAERSAEPDVLDDAEDGEMFDVAAAFGEDEGTETSTGDDVADPSPDQGEPPAKPQGDQPRDEQGRFLPKGDEPEGDKPEETPTPAADAPQEGEGETPAPTPTEPAAATEETFRFVAERQEYEIPGSKVTPEGIFIPKEAAEQTARLLSHGRVYATRWREIEQERRQLASERERLATAKSESEVKFDAVMKRLESMRGNDDEIAEFLSDTYQNWDRMLLEADRAALEAQKAQLQAPAKSDEDYVAEAHQILPDELAAIAPQVDALKHLTPQQVQQLAADFVQLDLIDKVFFVGEEDDPQGRWRKGQLVFNAPLAAQYMARFAPPPAAPKVDADAAAKNARLEGRSGGNNAPPPRKPAPPSGASGVPLLPAIGDYAAKREWDDLSDALKEKSIAQGKRAAKGKWSWQGSE